MSDVVTKTQVRLSFANLIEPRAQNEGDEKKYGTAILIPKTDTETVKAVQEAISAAVVEATAKLWKGKTPSGLHNPLRDGDSKENKDGDPDENYAGHWFLNAKGPRGGKEQPMLLDKSGARTADPTKVYSGVFGQVSLQFYGYDVSGNKGIAASINSFLSAETGDSFAAPVVTEASAAAAFGITRPEAAAAAAFAGSGSSEDAGAPASEGASAPAPEGEKDIWGS